MRPKLRGPKRRIHLVISAAASQTLMYFCLSRDPTTRDALMGDILRLAEPFDGVQIDFSKLELPTNCGACHGRAQSSTFLSRDREATIGVFRKVLVDTLDEK